MTRFPAFLFMDWSHINKGMMRATLDPARLTERGRQQVINYKEKHNLVYEINEHGFNRTSLPTGIKLALETPEKSGFWLEADKPWENVLDFTMTVIQEDGKYRCWYPCQLPLEEVELIFEEDRVMNASRIVLCYAESGDGFVWTKPNLGIFSFNGSTDNNIVSHCCSTAAVFKDESAEPEERYKCLHFATIPDRSADPANITNARKGLYGAVSSDGLHWQTIEQPLIRMFCDSQNVACWDPISKKYMAYVRGSYEGRAIFFSEADSFREWPHPKVLMYPGPEDEPSTDYYTNGFTWYPDDPAIKFLFSGIYSHNTDQLHVRLGISRAGRNYQWISREPVLDVGPAGSWDGERVYANPNLVKLPDGRLALPYTGYDFSHNETRFFQMYDDFAGNCRYGWAIWEEGRIAGVEAEDAGEFFTSTHRAGLHHELTRVFNGNGIEVNARSTRAGIVEIELWEDGNCLEGYSFADFKAIVGDHLWIRCEWSGKSDLSELAGKAIQLRFRMRSAKVFGYRYC